MVFTVSSQSPPDWTENDFKTFNLSEKNQNKMMTLLVQKRNDEKDNQDILTLKRKNPVKLTQLPKFMCKFLTSLCAVTCWSVMMYYCDVMYCRSASLQQATERHDVSLMLCIVDLRHCSKLQNVMMYYCDVMYCRSTSLQQATERHDVSLMLCIVDLRHCSKLQNVMMYH